VGVPVVRPTTSLPGTYGKWGRTRHEPVSEVRVGVVDWRGGDVDEELASAGMGAGRLTAVSTSGPPVRVIWMARMKSSFIDDNVTYLAQVNYHFDKEWAARATVDRMMKASAGSWRDLTAALRR
jgi:hypothetical protein